MIAALFVEADGVYYGLPDVDCWDIERNALTYCGPHPVVVHPPCQRWGRMATGGPAWPKDKPRPKVGDDGGCFYAALHAVRRWGGVLEHPADSKAWDYFGIGKPSRGTGWEYGDELGKTCYVEQGHYGHMSGIMYHPPPRAGGAEMSARLSCLLSRLSPFKRRRKLKITLHASQAARIAYETGLRAKGIEPLVFTMRDPATGALVVKPEFDLEIQKAIMGAAKDIDLGNQRRLRALYFEKLRLDLREASLRLRIFFLRKFLNCRGNRHGVSPRPKGGV